MKLKDKVYDVLVKPIVNAELTEFKRVLARTIPTPDLEFEVELCGHCNMNCWGCNHFSPLCKEEYLDVQEYEKDIKRLGEIYNGEMYEIRLLGGEPLLHPEICRFMEVTRRYFPNGIVQIVTNGILLRNMKEDFWDTCKNNNVEIAVTYYPIKQSYDEIMWMGTAYGVRMLVNGVAGGGQPPKHHMMQNLYPLDVYGEQDINRMFLGCSSANGCHTLKHGRMYTCSIAPHIHRFRDYFGVDIHVSDRDSINIYTATADEINKFLALPIPFCKYCDVDHRQTDYHEWGPSNKEIGEWTL